MNCSRCGAELKPSNPFVFVQACFCESCIETIVNEWVEWVEKPIGVEPVGQPA